MLFWAIPFTTPVPQSFFGYPLLSQVRVKATDFRFGWYIHRVHPNKSPLKILQKMECGRINGLPRFFGYPLLSQERVA